MKLILHIGTEKTGTTSIQHALARSRNELCHNGILYPKLLNTENHMEIAVVGMGLRSDDTIQIQELARTGNDLSAYLDAVRGALAAEIDVAKPHTLLISSEHLHSRLPDVEDVERLADFLGRDFDDVKVIVYLRRQDRMAVSLHSTRLKGGGIGEMLPIYQVPPPYFDLNALLERYAAVFGAQAIVPRIYHRSELREGDVVKDFYASAGLGITPPEINNQNISVSRRQAQFLKLMNERLPLIEDGKINPARGPIFFAIHKVLPGPAARPSRDEALRFQAQFDALNRLARDRFLPEVDPPTLFDDDFSSYPEVGDLGQPLTEGDFADFAEALWRFARNQIAKP